LFAPGGKPDGTEVAALNISCIGVVDLPKIAMTPFDGRSL